MDAIDLLDSDVAELPRMAGAGVYLDHLRRAFLSYVDMAATLSGTDFASAQTRAAAGTMRTLSEHLIAVHEAVLLGKSATARSEISAAIRTVKDELDLITSKPLDQGALGTVFRLRPAAMAERVDRGGMFHIPFDLRYLVTPHRYSLLGIPMLYLGSTLFVCWEELGRPPLDEVWVCALRLKDDKTIRLLDFGHRPALMAALLHQHGSRDTWETRLAVAYAIIWPLIAACSFRKRYPYASFVEEYVIPQQVLSYLVESETFDGIRYFSNHAQSYSDSTLTHNFVFPARELSASRFCPKLTDRFEMTPPMPWSLVLPLGPKVNTGGPLVSSRGGILEAIPGHAVDYRRTEFARVEAHLEAQTFAPVL